MGIKDLIIREAVVALINALPPDLLTRGADKLLDSIEDVVESSETMIDDAVILPLVRLLRASFDIPDND